MSSSKIEKVALVTGGAQGIGLAIAERFVQAGARTVLADVNEQGAMLVANRLCAEGHTAIGIGVDVSEPTQVVAMVDRVLQSFGQIDILVNNAGILGPTAPLWEVSDVDWQRVLMVDLTSVFFCCREVIKIMRGRRRGAIVNVASVSGKEGAPNLTPYAVAKAGVIGLTKSLAREVAADGVRVNCVAPALTQTPILSQMGPEQMALLASKIPLGRLGRAEEVAAVVYFLASDDASFVTGQCYDVSGGRATY